MPFRAPEVASRYGGLDDEAFGDGRDTGAEKLREIVRSANVLTGREHLVYSWQVDANPPGGETGYGLICAAPFWQLATPAQPGGIPVPKKFGLNRLRMFVIADIDDERVVEMHLATTGDQNPATAAAPTLVMRGRGAAELYSVADIPCRPAAGEIVALTLRARIDVDNDPLLDIGTYGGVASGTIDSAPSLYSMRDNGAGWNAMGNTVHIGGHYLVTRDATGAQRMPAAEIRAVGPDAGGGETDELIFWGPASDYRHLVGADYEIRKLPGVRLISIAIYAQDKGPA